MALHADIKKILLKERLNSKKYCPRQAHFDNVAKQMGYENGNIAFKALGKDFIEKAKVGAPSLNKK